MLTALAPLLLDGYIQLRTHETFCFFKFCFLLVVPQNLDGQPKSATSLTLRGRARFARGSSIGYAADAKLALRAAALVARCSQRPRPRRRFQTSRQIISSASLGFFFLFEHSSTKLMIKRPHTHYSLASSSSSSYSPFSSFPTYFWKAFFPSFVSQPSNSGENLMTGVSSAVAEGEKGARAQLDDNVAWPADIGFRGV